jgi:fructokinase
MYLGGIETGGTKIVCGIGTKTGEIIERTSFPTTNPEENLEQIFSFFKDKEIKAIGIGSFGPVDVNKNSDSYGYIKNTPKPFWSNFNLVGEIGKRYSVPIGFDTDVNAAALGEMEWGAAQGLDSCLYMTVGTGIGVGAISDGAIIHGMSHPEMGHIIIRRHPEDKFEGNCKYHHDCLEGMAAGPAMEKRWGKKGIELKDTKNVWEIQSYYLAQAITNFILILSPKKIILGGGVMKQAQLFPLIREKVAKNLNNYIQSKELCSMENYIVSPGLGDNAGLCGSFALAKKALE